MKAPAAKRTKRAKGAGRPFGSFKYDSGRAERYNVSLPPEIAAEIRDFGGGLSPGIVKAWQLMREHFHGEST